MIRPEIPCEGDAVETLLALANSFLPGLDLSRLSADPGITGSETRAGIALAKARYQLLIDQLPAATFIAWFENGRCELYVGSYIETLLGYTATEWSENPVLWYQRLHPDDRRQFMHGMGYDITELKHTEEDLRQSRDKEQRANRAKSEFLSRTSQQRETSASANRRRA